MAKRASHKRRSWWELGSLERIESYYALGYLLVIAQASPGREIRRLSPEQGEIRRRAENKAESDGERTFRFRAERRRSAKETSRYFANVFRLPYEPTSVEAVHAEGVKRTTVQSMPRELFPGLYELLQGIEDGQRDGVREGVGFSAGLRMNQALRAAVDDLRSVRVGETSGERDDDNVPPFASVGSGPEAIVRAVVTAVGVLNPFGPHQLLFVKVAASPNGAPSQNR